MPAGSCVHSSEWGENTALCQENMNNTSVLNEDAELADVRCSHVAFRDLCVCHKSHASGAEFPVSGEIEHKPGQDCTPVRLFVATV